MPSRENSRQIINGQIEVGSGEGIRVPMLGFSEDGTEGIHVPKSTPLMHPCQCLRISDTRSWGS
jgi:hypothetical protein